MRSLTTAFLNGEASFEELQDALDLNRLAHEVASDPSNQLPDGSYQLPNGMRFRIFAGTVGRDCDA